MSATERRQILLGSEKHRRHVGDIVAGLDRGYMVTIDPPMRTIPQNSTLHMLIADAVAGGLATDSGRRLTTEEAKTAFVTGWMRDNGEPDDLIAFSGHSVQLRRSTTTFNKAELASLIDYVLSECAQRGIPVRDPEVQPATGKGERNG